MERSMGRELVANMRASMAGRLRLIALVAEGAIALLAALRRKLINPGTDRLTGQAIKTESGNCSSNQEREGLGYGTVAAMPQNGDRISVTSNAGVAP
jgi:hypothetical protein